MQSNTRKLFTVDPDSGVTTEIDLGGENVLRGDGILLHGRTLYIVQNCDNQVAKIRLEADFSSGIVLSRTTDADFDVPTTVAAFGRSLYLVTPRSVLRTRAPADYWVTRLAKP